MATGEPLPVCPLENSPVQFFNLKQQQFSTMAEDDAPSDHADEDRRTDDDVTDSSSSHSSSDEDEDTGAAIHPDLKG